MAGILIDEKALAEIRKLPCCLCGQPGATARDGANQAHHIVKRGMGGGRRFDHRYNLLAVCWRCHETLDRMPRWMQFYLVSIREHRGGHTGPSDWFDNWVHERTRERDRVPMETQVEAE